MKNTITLIYDSIDIIVAFILGVWFIATKGRLTRKDKPTHKFPTKWFYIGGYIAILYGIAQIINKFFL